MKFLLLLLSTIAFADTPPPGTVKIKGGTDSTTIGNVSDSFKVNVTNTPSISGTVTSNQGTSPWVSSISNFPATTAVTQSTSPWVVSGTVTATQTALVTGQISNNASVTTVASTFTAPANAIGFILEAESGNTQNIRWAVGSTATASVGVIAEPGRDTGYIPLAANISVIAISGTQAVDVQWVMR